MIHSSATTAQRTYELGSNGGPRLLFFTKEVLSHLFQFLGLTKSQIDVCIGPKLESSVVDMGIEKTTPVRYEVDVHLTIRIDLSLGKYVAAIVRDAEMLAGGRYLPTDRNREALLLYSKYIAFEVLARRLDRFEQRHPLRFIATLPKPFMNVPSSRRCVRRSEHAHYCISVFCNLNFSDFPHNLGKHSHSIATRHRFAEIKHLTPSRKRWHA